MCSVKRKEERGRSYVSLTDRWDSGEGVGGHWRTSRKSDSDIVRGEAHTSNLRFVDAVEVALFQLQKQHFYHYIVIYNITVRGHHGITRLLVTVADSRCGTYYNVFHRGTSKTSDSFKMIYNDRKCQLGEAARGNDDGVHGAVRPFSANFPLVINVSSRLSGRRRLHV